VKMTTKFLSIPRGIIEVYHRIGVVGASDGAELSGHKTPFETLVLIAGVEFTVYWSKMPTPQFAREFMRRLV